METKTFNYENCTVVVHIPEDNQKVVKEATEKFLKELMARKEV